MLSRALSVSLLITILFSYIFIALNVKILKADDVFVINNIEVKGNIRISSQTIVSYLGVSEGDRVKISELNRLIKILYKTKFFSSVNIKKVNTGKLIVNVVENPLVNQVVFEGNKRIKDNLLSKEVSVKSKEVLFKSKIKSDLLRLTEIYKRNGRVYAKVTPKIIKLKNNRVDIIYEIKEGKKATIKNIMFVGNNKFSSRKLHSVIKSKEKSFFFFSLESYDPDKMNFDKELLRKFYLTKGYLDFSNISAHAELDQDISSFSLMFFIEEGKRYKFKKSNIISEISDINIKKLKHLTKLRKGKVFDIRVIDKTVEAIRKKLMNLGYAFVAVDYDIKKYPNKQYADVTYIIRESMKVSIGQINIIGNNHTEDQVIRSELKVVEGDLYNVDLLQRSKQKVNNLGFFSKVDIRVNRVSDDLVGIDMMVEEKPTGSLEFGMAYSTFEKFVITTKITERNLMGKAHQISLGGQLGKSSNQIDLSYVVPKFKGNDIDVGFNLFRVGSDFSELSYDSQSVGAGVNASYSVTEYLSHNMGYTYKTDEITNIQANVSSYIRDQEGKLSSSLISSNFFYDKTNNRFVPTEGYSLSLRQLLATPGGDARYLRNEVSANYYKSFFDDNVTLKLGINMGRVNSYGDAELKINNRFHIGGNQIRGFDYAGIGPRDKRDDSALGAKNYYYGTSQLSFPIGLPKEIAIKGLLFYDFGSAYGITDKSIDKTYLNDDKTMRSSMGLGVFWTSPLGPVMISWSVPISKESYDKIEKFKVAIGASF